MNNMDIYQAVKSVPQEAQKQINAGRLKGMTDINPMWRIQTLTERFGPAGIGWYYKIVDKWVENGAGDEKCAFVNIELYIKNGDEWSAPIIGTGGSMLVANERSGLHTSDEAYKMALTDAISVACKALGMGADVYWAAGRSKYTSSPSADELVTEKDIQMLEGLFAQEPDGGKILRSLLLNGRDIKTLTKQEYAEIKSQYGKHKNNAENIQQRLANGTKALAKKANLEYDAAKQMIENCLEVDFNKVGANEIQGVVDKIKAMIKDISAQGDTQ